MKILIIGFNARPLVTGLKLLSHKTIVIDYWGDLDIKPYCDELISFQKYNNSKVRNEWNEENVLQKVDKIYKKNKDIDYAIIGSGFDDSADFWIRLNKYYNLLNIKTDTLTKIRQRENLMDILKKNGIPHIPIKKIRNNSDIKKFIKQFGYPVIFRPEKSSGAYQLKIIENEDQLEKFILKKSNFYLEKYIPNTISLSQIVNCSQSDSEIIISNLQIINPNKNDENTMNYCGNISPYINQKISLNMEKITRKIVKILNFRGILGFDYILSENKKLYLTEINPRIPASIDPAQIATQTNLIDHHLKAVILDKVPKKPITRGFATKLIVRSKIPYKTPQIPINLPISDIPPPNILLNPNSPLCTIHTFHPNNLIESYLHAKNIETILHLLNRNNKVL